MKKLIALTFAAATIAAFAASYNKAVAPAGKDNIAFGYGAGYQSSGANTNVVAIGTDAGMGSANNTDCIFIGKEAGKNVSGKTGSIDIGGVFKYDDSKVNLNVDSIDNVYLGESKYWELLAEKFSFMISGEYVTFTGVSLLSNGAKYLSPSDSMSVSVKMDYDNSKSRFVVTNGELDPHGFVALECDLPYDADNAPNLKFKFENGQFNVYTNTAGGTSVKAGTLTFTPAQ